MSQLDIETRSSHNSYLLVLVESGLLGFFFFYFPFLYHFLFPLVWYLDIRNNKFELYVLLSFFGLIIYFYNISNFYSTSTWVFMGLVSGAAKYVTNTRKLQ